ncbi:MAG: hypothetical protein AAF628_07735 [Planctomycetota bacterium]
MFVTPTPSLPIGAAAFVRDLSVVDDRAVAIGIEPTGVGDWRLETVPTGPVEARYRILFHQDRYGDWPGGLDEHGYRTDEGVLLRSAALFLLAGRRGGPYEVRFVLPPEWHAATAWRRVGEAFCVEELPTLIYNAVFLGTPRPRTIPLDGFEVRLVVGAGVGGEAVFVGFCDRCCAAIAACSANRRRGRRT